MNAYSYSFPTLTIKVDDYNTVAQNPNLLSELRRLTLEPTSGMNYELDNFARISRERKVNCLIFMAYRGDQMVAWALLSAEASGFFFWNSDKGFNPEDGLLFEVYVDPAYRQQGIGSQLLRFAKNRAGERRLCICPHDEPSYGFYGNFTHYETKHL